MARITVATLNIWNRLGPWEERLALIREELSELEPDLFGLQEVLAGPAYPGDRSQAHEIAAGLSYQVAYGAGHVVADGLTFGNALLTRHGIGRVTCHELPGTEQTDRRRSVLHAVVDHPLGSLHAFVTHLTWRPTEGVIRVAQARAIRSLMESELDQAPLPAFAMGDFNAPPTAPEIEVLTAERAGRVIVLDAWEAGGDGGPGHTRVPDENAYVDPRHGKPERIDYVFAAGGRETVVDLRLSARVAFREPSGPVWPSDHFGLVVTAHVQGAR